MENDIQPEWLVQEFVFQEALLERLNLAKVGVVELVFAISDMNLSIHHSFWQQSEPFDSLYPDRLLYVGLRDVAFVVIDRLAVHREGLFSIQGDSLLDDDPIAQEGPKTVVGVQLLESSDHLDRLGDHKTGYFHLCVETMDCTIDVVFRRLTLMPDYHPTIE